MLVASVVYNKPSFIPYHYECLKKWLVVNNLQYYIFDNSEDPSIESEFRSIASYLAIKYIRIPPNVHSGLPNDPSHRAGRSLNYTIQYINSVLNYKDVCMIVDSDAFLTTAYDPIKTIGDCDMYGVDPGYKITYLTNQFLIMNFGTLPDVNNISFLPANVNGTQTDCGGLLNLYFQKNPSVKVGFVKRIVGGSISKDNIHQVPVHMIPFFNTEYSLFENAFAEVFDSAFLHLRAGSNWIGHTSDVVFKREEQLFKFLCNILINWEEVIAPNDNDKYVISFSLYGDKPKYTLNTIVNCLLAQVVYKGWTVRIYYDDSVPNSIIECIRSISNTELVKKENVKNNPGDERRLWRFHPASDPDVAAFLSRDSDSWLSFREAFLVRDWILSTKGTHIVRDHCYHSKQMMAGMWGMKRNIFPEMKELCDAYAMNNTYDQGFLERDVYPKVISNSMVHIGVQKNIEGIPTEGYFNDGGIAMLPYPRITEYIPHVNIERINALNAINCLHCHNVHNFFVGEMVDNCDWNTLHYLRVIFPVLNEFTYQNL